ncbi:MAG: hypothetical protein GDA36_12255 [Rhodobacteraceae bacterium]|nr:hypothetical protein [Paracoccaceae bacterium]
MIWFYAITGVCGLRVILFVLPDYRQRQLGVLFCPARTIGRQLYRGIGIAQSIKRHLEISLPPRCSWARRG